MPRTREPGRLDTIVAAATAAFTKFGYDRTKIHRVADAARVGPGTVYLYAADKEALFELSLLRSLESPIVAQPSLPYQKTDSNALRALLVDCLREVTHFPQLWVAMQRRDPNEARDEYLGILLELARWIRRYRSAILIADRNQHDWPLVAEEFERVVWTDLHQRLTTYLALRIRSGLLLPAGDPAMIARFTLDAMVAVLVTGPLSLPTDLGTPDDEAITKLVAAAVIGSGDRLPFSSHPR